MPRQCSPSDPEDARRRAEPLLECDDGRFWVVKFRNNPQHRRVLVNEWVASVFLRYLGIAAPDTAFVNLSADFLARIPTLA